MILIGVYFSPFTRRVAASLHVLGLPFEQRALHAFNDREAVREYNRLTRVPALVLDHGEILIDSTAILDYLDEEVGPERALMPPSGKDRRHVLQLVAHGIGAIDKASAVYYETLRPADKVLSEIIERSTDQVMGGLGVIEAIKDEPWLCGSRLTQADITGVIAYQTANFIMPESVNEKSFPRLAERSARASTIPAFAQTHPMVA